MHAFWWLTSTFIAELIKRYAISAWHLGVDVTHRDCCVEGALLASLHESICFVTVLQLVLLMRQIDILGIELL